MNTPFEKIKRTVSYHYFRLKNGWHFPPNIAHLSGSKMAKGTYEPEVTDIIKNCLTSGSVFIDVGANVGYFAREAAGMVKSEGRVYAFEVEYDNYYSLCKNTAFLNNVIPLHFAVSNQATFLYVNHSSHSACHSLVQTENHLDGSKFMVPAITIDDFWRQYLGKQAIDLIKIDVEGAELLVLEGMSRVLYENKIQKMIIEYCPRVLNNSGQDTHEIYNVLSKDFSLSIIEKEYKNLQKSGTIAGIKEFQKISGYLLELEDAVNINLLCEKS